MSNTGIGLFNMPVYVLGIIIVASLFTLFLSSIFFYFAPSSREIASGKKPALTIIAFLVYTVSIGLLIIWAVTWVSSNFSNGEDPFVISIIGSIVLGLVFLLLPLWAWHGLRLPSDDDVDVF